MHRSLLTLLFLIITHGYYCVCFLQVFKDCTYKAGKDKLTLYSNVFNITTRGKTLFFSPCGEKLEECNAAAAVCLLEKGRVKSLAKEFHLIKNDDEDLILQSFGGEKCPEDPTKNYTVTVEFECKKTMKFTPKFVQEDDDNPCHYKISMLKPTCPLPCAVNIHGNLIDLRPFKKFGDITVPSENGEYYFRFCGAATKCRTDNMVACLKAANDTFVNIAEVSSLQLKYTQKEGLVLKGKHKYGMPASAYNTLEIVLRCNWTTEFANPRYIKPMTQGRNYKFMVDSSRACIKLPMPCKAIDENQALYDISGLHNKDSFWIAKNYTNGSLKLNVCGQIHQSYTVGNNDCSNTDAQICRINNAIYESKGSLYGDLVAKNEVLHITLTDGSLCKFSNKTVDSRTEMEFKCSSVEKGPVFKGEVNCTSHILWETPHACPYYEYMGPNCNIVDALGKRNLSGIRLQTDKNVRLDASTLRYNLCGPLNTPCAGFKNVSACLITKNHREYIIGWENTVLKSKNGILSLDLVGEKCNRGLGNGGISVNFVCDYDAINATYDAKVIKDSCLFNVTVRTSLACLSQTKTQCSVANGTSFYDLSPLTLHDSNYYVTDPGNRQFEYIINVCRPIVINSEALCRMSTTICQRNTTDFNVKRTFKSLATLQPLDVAGDRLKIESGSEYCALGSNYRSVLYFECSQREEGPRLVKQSPCSYEFLWRTPHACPKEAPRKRRCVLHDANNKQDLNLTDIKQQVVLLKDDSSSTTLTFDICVDNYTKCSGDNNACEIVNITKTLVFKPDSKYINIETNGNCVLRVHLECGENDGLSKKDAKVSSTGKCSLELYLRSKMACDEKGKLTYETATESIIQGNLSIQTANESLIPGKLTYETATESVSQSIVAKPKIHTLNQNTITYPAECAIAKKFNMSKIDPIELLSKTNTTYKLHLTNIFTTNTTNKNCPKTRINHEHRDVLVNFETRQRCNATGGFIWNVTFKCHEATAYVQINTEESCSVTANYFTREVCQIFVTSSSVTVAAVVVSVVGLVVALLGGLYCYIWRGKRKYSFLDGEDKRIYLKETADEISLGRKNN